MPRYTLEEKAVLDILKAVSDINLSPEYVAMYLNQSAGPAMRVLEEILALAGYSKMVEANGLKNKDKNTFATSSGRATTLLDNGSTELELQAEILGRVWLEYRSEDALSELFEYSDLGFPLAYAYSNNLITLNEQSANFIMETFEILLETIEEDSMRVYNDVENFFEDLEAWLSSASSTWADDSGKIEDDDEAFVEEYDSDLAYMEYKAKENATLNDSNPENDYRI
jgi:hypothetical protein